MASTQSAPVNDVVITGMSGRFPNSQNAKEYIDSLLNKEDLCNEDERHWKINNAEVPKVGGRLWDVHHFDPGNFGIHALQSHDTDPMERMFLEEVFQALFDAGIHPDTLKGTNTGVFVGACGSESEMVLYQEQYVRAIHPLLGLTRSMISQTVSYCLQLNGPAINVDSACSSGMYAFEAAYSAIRDGRCDRAIVGGTNLTLHPFSTMQFARLGVLNFGSGCRPFDDEAAGYTRGEAIVALILQRRPEAKRIYGRLVHAKSNADGFKKHGITFPSSEGQLAVLQEVYGDYKINPKDVGFVEAHGTGTIVGDLEELFVIDEFFKPTQKEPLLIGSVKGNIGHTEPAAGLCSLVKVLHALNKSEIPPNINYKTPRRGVSALAENRLKVVTESTPFPPNKKYAGINSFGFGGANSHAIIEKYEKKQTMKPAVFQLACYSARTQAGLDAIHNEIVNCKNQEYLALMQETFLANISTHLYRGYTIVGKNFRSFARISMGNQSKVMVIMGTFSSDNCLQRLSKIPMLDNIMNQLIAESESVTVHQVLLESFKELGLIIVMGDVSKKIIDQWIKAKAIYRNRGTIIVLGRTPLKEKLEKKCNLVIFDDALNEQRYLCNIGRLYELGFQPQIQKLSHPVNFPVSSGTNILCHLMKWKKKLHRPLQIQSDWKFLSEEAQIINMVNKKHMFYKGHKIDGRYLFPATGYLCLVWELFTKLSERWALHKDIVFENVKFLRACTLTANTPLELYLVIQVGGCFEVSENNSTIVKGKIRFYDEKSEESETFITDEQEKFGESAKDYVLSTKEAYRELRLRGYNYGGMFRAIQEVSPTVATVKWENNWVTFLDNMMQVCILNLDTRGLYVPVGINRLVIRSKAHVEMLEKKEDKLVPVRFFKDQRTVSSKYVEMRGVIARTIARKKERLQPVLESYQFIPNEYTTDLATSIRINIQLLLESKQIATFTVLEKVGELENESSIITPQICNAIEDLPQVLPEMTIVTSKTDLEIPNCKIEEKTMKRGLLFICKETVGMVFDGIEKNLMPDGFVMYFCLREQTFPGSYNVLTKHVLKPAKILQDGVETNTEKPTFPYAMVYFLRKRLQKTFNPLIVDVSNTTDISWLQSVQSAMKTASEVVLIAQDNNKHGILGFTNCLNKEPGCEKIACIFNQDNSVLFDVNNNDSNVQQQLKKQMKINVYRDGQWGTYRHLLLAETDKVLSHHWFARTLNPGDLSTLKWIQGPLRPEEPAKIKIMYAALNFRDLMLASGKLSPEAITRDRLLQSRLQGFEYVGYSNNGTRVFASGTCGISNLSSQWMLSIPIPESFSMQESATVFIVYGTVMYGLIHKGNIKKGQSVLIHSGTGGVGLAALNICTHYDCEIFVTVSTQEKRDYIQEHYPNIQPSHIGNSRDTTFKEMVMKETKGRGVDFVLNSLAEEKLQASVECLARGGTFIEIGKYDLEQDNQLFVDLVLKECRHIGVMLDSILTGGNSNILVKLWKNALQDGYVKPLPCTVFEMHELEKAFKYMATGKHIGKVLIRIDHDKPHKVMPMYHCDPTKSYIVFGGLGGFGLELADWLYMRGAKHIVLSSRTGVTTGYQKYRISLWKSSGVKVTILTENVTDYNTCYEAMKNLNAIAPIDGIFNLAVVLKDSIFEHQTIETMKISMEPKAILTEHLDRISREICPTMRTFVVFSSVSCGRGNAGQTNYGYSNSVMERICEARHASGFPALAIQWGAIGDVGLLETLQKEHNEIAIGGTLQQKVGNCLEVFDKLLMQPNPIVSSIVVAEKFNKQAAGSPVEAVCQIMGIKNVNAISPNATLPELGMDSMLAVEIKQTLERDFDILLTPNDLRNLTFAKLDEIIERGSTQASSAQNVLGVQLSMLTPRVQMALTNKRIVDYYAETSKHAGDFILAFPGIDTDINDFEAIANHIKTPMKVVNYDAIALQQENVDVIVDYLFQTLKDEITFSKTFKFLAHSIGSLAAIELVKRFEAINITGILILMDGAPELIYNIFDMVGGKNENKLELNVIELMLNGVAPNLDLTDLKEILPKHTGFKERINYTIHKYLDSKDEAVVSKLMSLACSFHSRLLSIPAYQARTHDTTIKSNVMLYKPIRNVMPGKISDDYNLSLICTNLKQVRTFDGDHKTIVINEKLHEQLAEDFKRV